MDDIWSNEDSKFIRKEESFYFDEDFTLQEGITIDLGIFSILRNPLRPIIPENRISNEKKEAENQNLQLFQHLVRKIYQKINENSNSYETFERNLVFEEYPFDKPTIEKLVNLITKNLTTIKKTKEEKIKLIFRLFFKFLKQKLQKQIVDTDENQFKKFQKQILEKYIESSEIKNYYELPFKYSSNFKTFNKRFLKILFTNENAKTDFEFFCENLQQILENYYEEKICLFSKKAFLYSYTHQNDEKLKKLKMPWSMHLYYECIAVAQEFLVKYTKD